PQVVADAKLIIDASNVEVQANVSLEEICINGDCDTFVLSPGLSWQFCKTARGPYDEIVTAILLSSMLAGKGLKVSSDGEWEDWQEARDLCHKLWPD
ncbi:hypothetical protein C8J56DRAFT_766489, partial [Mycena floridula]